MARSLSDAQVRRLHLSAQRLHPRQAQSVSSAAQVLKDICGVQAQDAQAAILAVRVRSAGLTASGVERARLQERSVVRTWCMRGTLHLLAAEDVGWLLSLFGPIFANANRRRRAQLGLDDDASAKGVRVIRDALAKQGPLTRAEIAKALARRGIPAEGQATIHLIYLAALQGIVCQGPDRGRQPTHILLKDWIDLEPALPANAARAELARRYLLAYGPAGPDDLAHWSGLPIGEMRAAWQSIAGELIEVNAAGRPAWMHKRHAAWLGRPAARSPIVRLLPSFDTYLLGYRDRSLALSPEHAKRIHPGGGIIHPALTADGRVLGTWRSQRRRDGIEVIVEPFEALALTVLRGIETEVADLARFLDRKATLSVLSKISE
ncbi:MAG TPA: winged helix DNA-binding domain-containing protein [Anaerolineae bacterium]|nr:winged helix DNA-binding domain-containing protein [Anaerolineae bacterium]